MIILGIETSADETAAAVVEDGRTPLSNVVQSQIDIQKVYHGIVPEVAARSHLEVILPVIHKALDDATCTWEDIDALAVTYAPGLIGSLLIGSLTARTLALLKNKPLYPIHHVKAHVYANFIVKDRKVTGSAISLKNNLQPKRNKASGPSFTPGAKPVIQKDSEPNELPSFPLLALIVSGGHSQLVLFRSHQKYEILGQTQDDAVGEAFDKVAKVIGLPYPGGPSIAEAAKSGDPNAYTLPKAKLTGKYDFSFSGLKTATLRKAQAIIGKDFTFPSSGIAPLLTQRQQQDLAASFQKTAIETLVDKTVLAYQDLCPTSVVIAGGVAANQALRHELSQRLPVVISYPPISLCTDNAAMIASLAYYQAQFEDPIDPRSLEVIPHLSM